MQRREIRLRRDAVSHKQERDPRDRQTPRNKWSRRTGQVFGSTRSKRRREKWLCGVCGHRIYSGRQPTRFGFTVAGRTRRGHKVRSFLKSYRTVLSLRSVRNRRSVPSYIISPMITYHTAICATPTAARLSVTTQCTRCCWCKVNIAARPTCALSCRSIAAIG